jgi:hypothetical protein
VDAKDGKSDEGIIGSSAGNLGTEGQAVVRKKLVM